MQLTPNLNLKKPEGTDVVDIADLNENADKLDTEVAKLASTTTPGRMSAADKGKLDSATSAATASTLVQRDASGRFKAAAPATADDVARKQEISDHADVKATTGGVYGHTTLVDAVNSTATDKAATANAVKQVFDRANRVAVNVLPDGADLNEVSIPGFYRLQGNHPNIPHGNCAYGQMLVIRGGADTITQIVFAHQDPALTFMRGGNPPQVGGSGQWNPWARVMTSAGGTYTGNVVMATGTGIYLENGVGIVGKRTDGAYSSLAHMASGNIAVFGTPGTPVAVHSSMVPSWWNGSVNRQLIHSGSAASNQDIAGHLTVHENLIGSALYSNYNNAATGGSMYLKNPQNTTNLQGSYTTVNMYGDAWRVYEIGGTNRGISLNLTQCAAGAGSELWHTGNLRINNGVLEFYYGGTWTPVGGGRPLSEPRKIDAPNNSISLPYNQWKTALDLNMAGRIEQFSARVSGSGSTVQVRITMDGKVVTDALATLHAGVLHYLYNEAGAHPFMPANAPISFNNRFLVEYRGNTEGFTPTGGYTIVYRQAY
ncbi:pyocin knob domain-containing protein [Paenibacillus sp. GCM10012303]|uniref:pyocin knob domain-containing protein n=1 Tax=Paenibacillus sp. GCM10012303 TaxID=3317340 RepID=UPI0036206C1E